jgi:hypothetical protein
MNIEKGPNFKVAGNVEKWNEKFIVGEMKKKLYEGHLLNLSEQEREEFLKNELPKTSEEIKFIRMANEETNKIMKKLGVSPYDIPEKNVHMLKNEFFQKFATKESHIPATVKPNLQAVLCNVGEVRKDRLLSAIMIFHEFVHMKSYLAYDTKVEIDEKRNAKKIRTHTYREGIGVNSPMKKNDEGKGRELFWGLNEAITSHEEKIYLKKLLDDPQFSKEKEHLFSGEVIKSKKLIKEQFGDEEDEICTVDLETNRFFGVGFKNFRRVLEYVCQEIARDTKRTTEEIHEEFLKSHFTGNILPIARLVEGSFGKGSFLQLGAMEGDKESAEKTLAELKKRREDKIT